MKKILINLIEDLEKKSVKFVNDDSIKKGYYSYDIGEKDILKSFINFSIYDEKKYGDREVNFNINFDKINKIINDIENIYIIEQEDSDIITIEFNS